MIRNRTRHYETGNRDALSWPNQHPGITHQRQGGRRAHYFPYSYDLNSDGLHAKAATALVRKLGWSGLWVGGGMPSEDGNVFVCVDGCMTDGEVNHWASQGAWGVRDQDWFHVVAEGR